MKGSFVEEDKKNIVLPDGKEHQLNTETDRAIVRQKEDSEYVPVIIKRSDEASRHPDDVLEQAIHEGIEQHQRSSKALFLSAMAAGLILGFTALCIAFIASYISAEQNPFQYRLATALIYPLGFIICILSGTQLFTEQTATAVYPVLEKKASYLSLHRVWITVLLGNFTGTLISSILIYMAKDVIGFTQGFISVADHLIHYNPGQIFISAVLAGWLMAQGGWLIHSLSSTTSQIISIFIVTFIIGIGGLHHSIAGSAEIFSGLLYSDSPDLLNSLKFLIFAVLGNLLGGSVFVAILNYGHIRKVK